MILQNWKMLIFSTNSDILLCCLQDLDSREFSLQPLDSEGQSVNMPHEDSWPISCWLVNIQVESNSFSLKDFHLTLGHLSTNGAKAREMALPHNGCSSPDSNGSTARWTQGNQGILPRCLLLNAKPEFLTSSKPKLTHLLLCDGLIFLVFHSCNVCQLCPSICC